jgi:hypothetical protein
MKSYWEMEDSFFHCPTISNIMTMERFKIRQVRWFVDEIKSACMKEWSLGKFLTIDEMMVRYKGSYCPIRQYMPKK